ncbi:MAG: NUDIX domain-containing protein [Actinomycetales bacterium]
MVTSAGIVLYRRTGSELEILLGHMGGPYWAKKDDGAWSIPKGEYDDTEDPYAAARREFEEEIGQPPPPGPRVDLGRITQRNGKVVIAFALEGDLDPAVVTCNTFQLEWPPRSGRIQTFPEIDRVAWFAVPAAARKALASQGELFDRLAAHLEQALD